jgi:hypothetical protein
VARPLGLLQLSENCVVAVSAGVPGPASTGSPPVVTARLGGGGGPASEKDNSGTSATAVSAGQNGHTFCWVHLQTRLNVSDVLDLYRQTLLPRYCCVNADVN